MPSAGPIKKFSAVITADATVHLPARAFEVIAMALTSSADTSVQLDVTDANSQTIATWASADYTTRTRRYLGPVETTVADTGGDASANTEHQPIGVIADGPLTLNQTGLGSGDLLVEIYYRELHKVSVALDTTNDATDVGLPGAGDHDLSILKAVAVTASADTTVALAVTDADSQTVGTWASADYTTRTLLALAPVETAVYDAGGDPSADTEGNEIGVLVEGGSLTVTATGLASGTFTVEIYYQS